MNTRPTQDQMFSASNKRYIICRDFEEACDMIASVVGEAALDFETTMLEPDSGKIRITSVCNDDVHFLIDHHFVGDFDKFAPMMLGKRWYVYNAKFETYWCDNKSGMREEIECFDVDFMAKAVMGGFSSSLAILCKKSLGFDLNKELQLSDWSKPSLTQQQYNYAAFDSYVTWEIKKHWANRMNAGHWKGAGVFNDAVRATTEAERTGLYLDSSYHTKLVNLWKVKHSTFERYLRKWTPPDVIDNLRSNQQLAAFFRKELPKSVIDAWPKTEKTKQMQMDSDFLRALCLRLPYPFNRWVAALVGFKYYDKYLSTYGDKLITIQAMSGKIKSRLNIGQAATGRYSSSSENLQNIPRKAVVRRSFIVPKRSGDLMCLADYKGIEVRTLGEVSGDALLIYDAIHSDVHATALAAIHKCSVDTILAILDNKNDKHYMSMKSDRTKRGKVFTFRLTYGAGLDTLADSLRMPVDEAQGVVEKWAERYPKAYGYRSLMFDQMNATGFLPVFDGRTIFVYKADRTIPVAANYPVQGAAASVMYRAMYRTRNRFIASDMDAIIAMTVHDELISYANQLCAEAAMQEQLRGMEQGWLDIFPNTSIENLIDWKIGTSWADKP